MQNKIEVDGVQQQPTTSNEFALMFTKIISHPCAFFKSQRKSEPDLTEEDKRNILNELLHQNSVLFLSRYAQYLCAEDICHFRTARQNISDADERAFEMDFYLKDMAKRTMRDPDNACSSNGSLVSAAKDKTARNRRYAALRRLEADGEYFHDRQMRDRQPLLFDRMVGQYLTDREKDDLLPCSDRSGTLTGLFMDFGDTKLTAERRRWEMLAEKDSIRENRLLRHAENLTLTVGESADSKDAETGETDEDSNSSDDYLDIDNPNGCSDHLSDSIDRDRLHREFISIMHERFLCGRDGDWVDYSTIDNDPSNDPLDLMQRDAEDAYFDSEEPD